MIDITEFIGPPWTEYGPSIALQIQTHGVETFRWFDEVKWMFADPEGDNHFQEYVDRCEEHLWPAGEFRLIEFGAGYGGMIDYWPERARITNIDLEPMLDIQRYWYRHRDAPELVPLSRIDEVDFEGVYFFSSFALTETTAAFWAYCFEHVFPKLAGIYLLGNKIFPRHQEKAWPWQRVFDMFDTTFLGHPAFAGPNNTHEFCGVRL